MQIAFLHPDLGIGGAERLVVDAALALRSKYHEIHLFTNHHDPKHCFPETTDGSLNVTVVAEWIPRNVFGKFFALCAYIRMIYAAFYVAFFSNFKPDLVFCDQVSVCIPVLKLKGLKVIFYCHYPDQLLTDRKHWLKRFYRWPLDWVEEKTTGMADVILVNSKFTAQTFRDTFPSLEHKPLEVLYPAIDPSSLLRPLEDAHLGVTTQARTIFLSLNRFERKKNVSLAIEAMAHLRSMWSSFSEVHLIVAGGYDVRVAENREHLSELRHLAEGLALADSVTFVRSPSDAAKRALLHGCTAVLYTPAHEHFGIVPLEAMLLGRPVLACDSGGPLETVLDGRTGFLCAPEPEAFAAKMLLFAKDKSRAREMGAAGSEHVRKHFTAEIFARHLDRVVQKTLLQSLSPTSQ